MAGFRGYPSFAEFAAQLARETVEGMKHDRVDFRSSLSSSAVMHPHPTFGDLQRFMDSIQHNWPDNTKSILYRAAELMGEAGEAGEKCKKVHRDRDGIPNADDLNGIAKEIGDVLICCANLASQLGIDLDVIASNAILKMHNRVGTKTVQGSGDDRELAPCAGAPPVSAAELAALTALTPEPEPYSIDSVLPGVICAGGETGRRVTWSDGVVTDVPYSECAYVARRAMQP